MEKTTLYLSSEIQRSLRDLSRRNGRPQASLIREALERYLAGQERPLPVSIGAANDGTLDAADSEAWLREAWDRGSPKARGPKPKSSREPRRTHARTSTRSPA